MDPYITMITLGVRDPAAARRFYVDGLGWRPVLEVDDDVIFIQVGRGLLLSLWNAEKLATEAGTPVVGDGDGTASPGPISLGHNVAEEEDVAAALDAAVAAGGRLIAPAQRQVWGGVSGYFADPDGYRWEVAYNPGLAFDEHGNAVFGEAEA